MKNTIITTKLPVGKQPKRLPLGGRGWLRLTIFPLVLVLLATSWNGRAASISWGTPTDVSGPSDVVTSGTLVGSAAYQGDITTAGMTFTGYKGSYGTPGKVGQSYYLIFNNITFDVSGGIGNTPSSYYTDLYAGSSMGTMFFSGSAGTSPAGIYLLGLTIGHQYEVQIWSQAWGANWTTIYGDTNGNNVTLNQQGASTGQFVAGKFTADGTNQVIYMICQANGYAFPPGAVQVRDISPLAVSVQPASPAAVAGSTVTINAVANYGSEPYTYQWYQNGTNLVGQTGSSLILSSVTLNMNGYTYAVEVSDGSTNVTSGSVELTVGTAKLFNVNVDDTGSHTMTGAAVLGASGDQWATINVLGSVIAVPDASGNSVAGVTFEVTGTTLCYGDANNNPNPLSLMYDFAYLQGGSIAGTYANLSAYNGCGYNLIVYASGENLAQGSIVTVNGQTLTVAGDSRDISAGMGHAYQTFSGTITNGQLAISVAPGPGGFAILDGAQLQVVIPPSPLTATVSPNNAAVVAGSTVTLGAIATGGSGTYAYQWYQVGVGSLTGQTNATLMLSGVTTNQTATSYYAAVNDGYVTVDTANVTLMVTPSLAQVLNAPYAPGLPVDANPAHWAGLGASSVYMDTRGFTNGTPRPPGDLGVTMQYAWDYTNLYILVREDTNFVTAGSQQESLTETNYQATPYSFDSIAFWMDLNNTAGTTINGTLVVKGAGDFQPWFGFSSLGLTNLFYARANNNANMDLAGLANARIATSGNFNNHNRVIEVAIAWADVAADVATNQQPGGKLLAAVGPGYKFGSEPLLVYNNYNSQCFMGGTNNPGNPWNPPSGVDTNSVDVQLVLVPTLQATLAGGQMVIRWPVAATGSLYTSPLLGAGATWTKVTSPAPVVDPNDSSKMKWTGPVTGTKAFYRLQ